MNFDVLKSKSTYFSLLALVGLYFMFRWQTVNNGNPDLYWSPVIWSLGGILASIFLFQLIQWKTVSDDSLKFSRQKILLLLLLIAGFIYSGTLLYDVFLQYPVTADGSDVIPSLEAYVKRFLSGEKVYKPIPFANYEVWPTYFPAMWLPYIVPELLGIDYRWMAFACFYISYIYIAYCTLTASDHFVRTLIISVFPVFMIYQFIKYDVSVFVYSTELLPITFYLWLIWGLFKKNIWLIGIFLALCTLSRYAYTLWIIPFVVIIIATDFRTLLRIAAIGTSTILILYVLPFLIWDPTILTDGLAYYGKTAEDQWRVQFWQGDDMIPYHLMQGYSFSFWFYDNVTGTHIEKLAVAKKFHLIISLFVVLFQLSLYFVRARHENWNHFLIIGLFGYLLIFYAFLYVPFSYLYMLPFIIGFMCWMLYGGNKVKATIKT